MINYLECSGSAFEIGKQYGKQVKAEIHVCLETFRRYIDKNKLPVILRILSQETPEIIEEFKGIAEGADASFDELLLMNNLPAGDECTPLFLKDSLNDGTIVAKNNDASPAENLPFVIRKVTPANGIPFIQLTYAGWLSGLDMMNEKGLASTSGSVGSVFVCPKGAIDIKLKMYQLMRKCESIDEVVLELKKSNLRGKGFAIALGDSSGSTVMLDAAVPVVMERKRDAKFAWATNLYESPGLENADQRPPEKRHICIYRNGYLNWIDQTRQPETLDDIKEILSSHEPWAPCRHAGAHGSRTTWSMICLPLHNKVLISHGQPCVNKYKEYSF